MAFDDAEFARCARRLTSAPGDGRAAADLARCAVETGREVEALPLVARAATRVGASAVLHQWAAVLARAVGDSETAFTHFAAAARIAPADVRIADGCALSALDAGWPAAALFDRALALDPLHEAGLLGRAAARLADGEFDRASAEIDTVLAAHPGWLQGHVRSAQLHWMAGRQDSFTASLDRALAGAPADPALWQTLFTVLAQAGRYQDMLSAVRRGRDTAWTLRVFDLAEATALSELGDSAAADRFLLARPDDPDSDWAIRRVRHLLRTGRAAAALPTLDHWLATPQAAAFWSYAATCWRLIGDPRHSWLEGDVRLIQEITLDVDLEAIGSRLRELHERRLGFFEQSVRGGTQTDGPLFARVDPVIARLRSACAAAVAAYVAQLPPRDASHPMLAGRRDRPLTFAGSWSVRLTDGGYHTSHVHPDGWLSSAFYVAVPPVDGGLLDLGVPPAELGIDLPPLRSVQPRPGRLVLFPSTMWHGTRPFAAGERLTVAFDVARPAR